MSPGVPTTVEPGKFDVMPTATHTRSLRWVAGWSRRLLATFAVLLALGISGRPVLPSTMAIDLQPTVSSASTTVSTTAGTVRHDPATAAPEQVVDAAGAGNHDHDQVHGSWLELNSPVVPPASFQTPGVPPSVPELADAIPAAPLGQRAPPRD